MNNKELLYRKIHALRLEVDCTIADSIKSTVDALFEDQNLQQADVSGSLPLTGAGIMAKAILRSNEIDTKKHDKLSFRFGYLAGYEDAHKKQ